MKLVTEEGQRFNSNGKDLRGGLAPKEPLPPCAHTPTPSVISVSSDVTLTVPCDTAISRRSLADSD